jgi:hypothetical protein
MIDEKARRTPRFTEGPQVVLGDGQMWRFPALRLRLSPARAEGDRFRVSANRTGLPRYEEWVAAITSQTVPARDYWDARMDAAASLLRLNYELTDEELAELLVWEPDDPAADERWDQIDAAILGTPPKACSAT